MSFPTQRTNFKNKKYYERTNLSRKKLSFSNREGCRYYSLQKQQGSATVETAIALPIVFTFLFSMFWLIKAICVHSIIGSITNEAGNLYVEYSYAYEALKGNKEDEDSLLELIADHIITEGIVRGMIERSEVYRHIDNLSCVLNTFGDTEGIDLLVTYCVKPFPFMAGMGGMRLTNRFYSNHYIGYSPKTAEKYVFITKDSEVYHTSTECRALKLTVLETTTKGIKSKRRSNQGKYYPCEACGKKDGRTVYYTPYGSKYHKFRKCPKLKQTIYTIPESEKGDRRICFYCK